MSDEWAHEVLRRLMDVQDRVGRIEAIVERHDLQDKILADDVEEMRAGLKSLRNRTSAIAAAVVAQVAQGANIAPLIGGFFGG